MNSAKRPSLPRFKSMAEAVALSKKEKDTFYVDTLYIQRWLARANNEAVAEYAEKKNARDRSLQTGSAWRLFRDSFGELSDPQFACIFKSMARLTTYDDPVSRCLAEARHAIQIEHDCTGDYFGPKTPQSKIKNQKSKIELLRLTLQRWCDWLDAANHLHVHRGWHLAPACFDPDLEKRDLAVLGLTQRNYSKLNDSTKAAWQHLHAQFAERFNSSPKWLTVGHAMSSTEKRLWTYHDLDTRIISLWPLLKKYNWTYRDLMNVIRSLLPLKRKPAFPAASASTLQRSNAANAFTYPCSREQDFTVHCRTVLGLRKTGRGKTTKPGQPSGAEIAQRLFAAASPGGTNRQ